MHNYYDRDAPLPADKASYKFLYNDYFHDSIITGLCVNSARRELELSLQCSRECEEEQGNRDNILEEKYGYRLYFSGLHHFGGSSALQWTEYLNGRFKAIRGAKGNFYFRIQTADGYMDIGYDRFRIRKVRGRVSYRGIDEISPWIDKAYAARPEEAAAIRKRLEDMAYAGKEDFDPNFDLERLYHAGAEALAPLLRQLVKAPWVPRETKVYAAWLLGKYGSAEDIPLILGQLQDCGDAMIQRNLLDAAERFPCLKNLVSS